MTFEDAKRNILIEAPGATCELSDYGNKIIVRAVDRERRVKTEMPLDWDEENFRSATRRLLSGE